MPNKLQRRFCILGGEIRDNKRTYPQCLAVGLGIDSPLLAPWHAVEIQDLYRPSRKEQTDSSKALFFKPEFPNSSLNQSLANANR